MRHFRKGGTPEAEASPSDVSDQWDMERALLHFTHADSWTWRNAFDGTNVTGSIGAGKTSGSGAAMAKAFLQHGAGGLVVCVKQSEAPMWIEYARATGREQDVILFNENNNFRFNPLYWEAHRQGRGASHAENLVELFMLLSGLLDTGDQSKDQAFFKNSLEDMLRNSITALQLAGEEVSFGRIDDFIHALPQSTAQGQNKAWRKTNYVYQVVAEAQRRACTPMQQHDLKAAQHYVMQWASYDPRTQGNILATYRSLASLLNSGLLHELFFRHRPNIVPELTYRKGAIILVDLPLQQYYRLGLLAAAIMKICFQRAMLQRDTSQFPRPTFLWIDEAARLIFPTDGEFQLLSRQAKVATVYLSQNIRGYVQAFGGDEHAAHNFLGNLSLKIFHQQNDVYTNQYAADVIGQHWMTVTSYNTTTDPSSGAGGMGGGSEAVQYELLPRTFGSLRKGGPANNLQVEAILWQGGTAFSTGKSWLKVVFKQGE